MRVFRPTYTARNGKRQPSPAWHVRFRDHRGERRRLVATTDKSASEVLGRRLEALVAIRVAGAHPDAELGRWLEGVRHDHLEKLLEWGLLDDGARSVADPLKTHVAHFREHLVARGNTKEHAVLREARLLKLFDGCQCVHWRDISAGVVEKWLADQRKSGAFGMRTSNYYAATVKGFCAWMVREGRGASSPVLRLKGVAVTDEKETSRVHSRAGREAHRRGPAA